MMGLSPPTRGNLVGAAARREYHRSIPAHAGEPVGKLALDRLRQVYPRPRGGTLAASIRVTSLGGLSPPTRGNHRRICRREQGDRSIPAHAGEPLYAEGQRPSGMVYPRPRGGTSRSSAAARGQRGLSPPTRGNRRANGIPRRVRGSIPAHAGEPDTAAGRSPESRVYPRPRGGTALSRE